MQEAKLNRRIKVGENLRRTCRVGRRNSASSTAWHTRWRTRDSTTQLVSSRLTARKRPSQLLNMNMRRSRLTPLLTLVKESRRPMLTSEQPRQMKTIPKRSNLFSFFLLFYTDEAYIPQLVFHSNLMRWNFNSLPLHRTFMIFCEVSTLEFPK